MTGIDPSIWIAIASAAAAWLALLLSLLNFRTSRRALRLSEQQEQRRKPALVPYLQEGFVSTNSVSNARVYAFLLSISNRSDSDNAVAEIIMHLTYSKAPDTELTVKFGTLSEIPVPFSHLMQNRLSMPTRIDAHQTVSGWYFFSLDAAVLKNARVQRSLIVLTDSHGQELIVEPMIVREYSDEVQDQSDQEDVPTVA